MYPTSGSEWDEEEKFLPIAESKALIIIKHSQLTLIRLGGEQYKPTTVSKILALEPTVGLTSNQAVNSSLKTNKIELL